MKRKTRNDFLLPIVSLTPGNPVASQLLSALFHVACAAAWLFAEGGQIPKQAPPPARVELRSPPAQEVPAPPPPKPTPPPMPVFRKPQVRKPRVSTPPLPQPPADKVVRGGLSEDSLSTVKSSSGPLVATGNSAEKPVSPQDQGLPVSSPMPSPEADDPFARPVSEVMADAQAQCERMRAGQIETTEEAQKAGVTSGIIIADVIIGKNGQVGSIKIVKGVGFGVDERVIRALEKWKCSAATMAGKPAAVRKRIEFEIVLQ